VAYCFAANHDSTPPSTQFIEFSPQHCALTSTSRTHLIISKTPFKFFWSFIGQWIVINSYSTRRFKYDRDWFMCKQAANHKPFLKTASGCFQNVGKKCVDSGGEYVAGWYVEVSVWQLWFKNKSVPVIFEPPCISNKMHHLSQIIYSCKTLYMFRIVFPSIIRSLKTVHRATGICHTDIVSDC
jgi:hypothetical protein